MQLAGKVQHRRTLRQYDAMRCRQLVDLDLGLGTFERPGKMVNVPHQQTSCMRGEQAVSRRQEMLEAAGNGRSCNLPQPAISRPKSYAAPCQQPPAVVRNCAVGSNLPPHASQKIRQMEEHSSAYDSESAGRIEREEEDASQTGYGGSNIGPQVEFAKLACAGNDNRALANGPGPHLVHPERHNADPRISVEAVDGKAWRKQTRDLFGGDWPMREQQIVPALRHAPTSGRK